MTDTTDARCLVTAHCFGPPINRTLTFTIDVYFSRDPLCRYSLALSPPTSSRSMEQSKASATVNVDAVAVESMTDDSAVVIVAARSDLTNPDHTKRDPESWRISITLKRDGGQLKISMVEFVQ